MQPHEVDIDDLAEESFDVTLLHADGDQRALLARGIPSKRAVPLGSGEAGFEVGGSQNRDGLAAGDVPCCI
jgi:hypothetical protein